MENGGNPKSLDRGVLNQFGISWLTTTMLGRYARDRREVLYRGRGRGKRIVGGMGWLTFSGVSSNKLGADGASAVAGALMVLSALRSLNVRLPDLKRDAGGGLGRDQRRWRSWRGYSI
jgi:hypothetical protein